MGRTDTAAYDRSLAGELTVMTTLAEYSGLIRTSTLRELEHRGDPRPFDLDSTVEVV